MSIFGIGPVFASLSIFYGLLVSIISRHYDPIFRITILPQYLLSALGSVLLLMGIPFLIVSIASVFKAYHSDSLMTHGIYKCCRHPVYSSWVVFIAPGIVLWANNWLGLTVPVFMYFLLGKLVKKEEDYLEQRFGAEYLDYKKKTPCILPYGWVNP